MKCLKFIPANCLPTNKTSSASSNSISSFKPPTKPQQNQLPFIFPEPNHPTNAQLNTSLYSFFLLSKSLQTLSNPFLFLSFLFLPIGSSQAFLSQSPFLLTLFLAFFFLFFSAPFSSSQLPPLVLAKKKPHFPISTLAHFSSQNVPCFLSSFQNTHLLKTSSITLPLSIPFSVFFFFFLFKSSFPSFSFSLKKTRHLLVSSSPSKQLTHALFLFHFQSHPPYVPLFSVQRIRHHP